MAFVARFLKAKQGSPRQEARASPEAPWPSQKPVPPHRPPGRLVTLHLTLVPKSPVPGAAMQQPTTAFTLAHQTPDMPRQGRKAALSASWVHQSPGLRGLLSALQGGCPIMEGARVWLLSPAVC